MVHVTSVLLPSFHEATGILFVHKANKNNEFIQQFFSSESLLRIHESITTHVFGAADAGVGVLM